MGLGEYSVHGYLTSPTKYWVWPEKYKCGSTQIVQLNDGRPEQYCMSGYCFVTDSREYVKKRIKNKKGKLMKISNSRTAKQTDTTRAEDTEQASSDQPRTDPAKQRSNCSNSFKIKYILIKNYN